MASIKKIDGKGGVSYKITVSMGRDSVTDRFVIIGRGNQIGQ